MKYEDFLSKKTDNLDISTSEFTYYLLNIFIHDDFSQRQLAGLARTAESNAAKEVKKSLKAKYIFPVTLMRKIKAGK